MYLTFQYFIHMYMYTHFPSKEPTGPLNYCNRHIRGTVQAGANLEMSLILARFGEWHTHELYPGTYKCRVQELNRNVKLREYEKCPPISPANPWDYIDLPREVTEDEPGVVVQSCTASAWEGKSGESGVQGQAQLYMGLETRPQTKEANKMNTMSTPECILCVCVCVCPDEAQYFVQLI